MLGDSIDHGIGRMENGRANNSNKQRLQNITNTPIGLSPNPSSSKLPEFDNLKEIIREKDDTINQLSMQITEVSQCNAGISQDSRA